MESFIQLIAGRHPGTEASTYTCCCEIPPKRCGLLLVKPTVTAPLPKQVVYKNPVHFLHGRTCCQAADGPTLERRAFINYKRAKNKELSAALNPYRWHARLPACLLDLFKRKKDKRILGRSGVVAHYDERRRCRKTLNPPPRCSAKQFKV